MRKFLQIKPLISSKTQWRATIPLRDLPCLIRNRFLQTDAIPSPASEPPPLGSALSLSKRLRIPQNNSPNSSSVLNCLKSHGFEDTQIAKLVRKRPDILNCKVQTKLKPKLRYLIQKGFTGKLLPDLILSNPFLLFRGLDSQIRPSFEFLRPFLNDEEMFVALKRASWLLTISLNSVLQPNVDLLISEGVPASRISKLLILQPRVLLQSHDRMVYAVKTIKEIGIEPKETRFIHALRVICSMSKSNWKKKVEVFMSLGWSKEEVLNTFKKDPLCLACSENKLRYLMDFYVNTMKLDARAIIAYPKLLGYSVERRVHARYIVLKALESMKLIKDDKKIVWVIKLPEKKFLEEYIAKHIDKVPGLLDMYHGAVKPRKTIRGKKEKFDPKSASLAL
ncbi:Mitochondrial transcription termination factor family protein, putative isoform 1 [Theobroma cacao]|uniref:Mitochondrial transcription termination factor family protein, putative isoform 1 n=2 Tax=Theobroma cacao TaxID=3641 RepID=A0A061FRH9_THECC|nr:Mitochondrial transcription termination factor family protein, putative isoform 1 [Theobroma cacao]